MNISSDFHISVGRRRDSPVRGAGYEPFDSILRPNRSQKSLEISIRRSSNDVRTLCDCESCRAEFSSTPPRDSTSPNSHNQPTEKINDKSMSVRDEEVYY